MAGKSLLSQAPGVEPHGAPHDVVLCLVEHAAIGALLGHIGNVVLIKVMPTWTVERKPLGLSARSMAIRAPSLPLPVISCRRNRFDDAMASSAMANTPFNRIRAKIHRTSVIKAAFW